VTFFELSTVLARKKHCFRLSALLFAWTSIFVWSEILWIWSFTGLLLQNTWHNNSNVIIWRRLRVIIGAAELKKKQKHILGGTDYHDADLICGHSYISSILWSTVKYSLWPCFQASGCSVSNCLKRRQLCYDYLLKELTILGVRLAGAWPESHQEQEQK
jgi:hypothetical protein